MARKKNPPPAPDPTPNPGEEAKPSEAGTPPQEPTPVPERSHFIQFLFNIYNEVTGQFPALINNIPNEILGKELRYGNKPIPFGAMMRLFNSSDSIIRLTINALERNPYMMPKASVIAQIREAFKALVFVQEQIKCLGEQYSAEVREPRMKKNEGQTWDQYLEAQERREE